MNVAEWMRNARTPLVGVNAANPARPLASYEITGTPAPVPVPMPAARWNQAQANAFPSRTLVPQPRKLTVIA